VFRIRTHAGIALAMALVATAASAQVPARSDAYVWRGFELEWGEWTHRLGTLDSSISALGDGTASVEVRQQIAGGVFRDPGGAHLTTHYTHFEPADTGELMFWHLQGDELVLGGDYRCGKHRNHDTGSYTRAMVLGDEGGVLRPGTIDPDGPTPGDFDRLMVVLNGLTIEAVTPNGSHTVDRIHVGIDGAPGYDGRTGLLEVPLKVEYRPGCVPGVFRTCANPVEMSKGARTWEVRIRPHFLVIAWNRGHASPLRAAGRMSLPDDDLVCGEDLDVRLAEASPFHATPPRDTEPLVGFATWGLDAGAPGAWYAEGEQKRSCENCAVRLTGRHLRDFAFMFERETTARGGFHAAVIGRWSSHPFDGNPFAVASTNPHWPSWSWGLVGIHAAGTFDDRALFTHDSPALAVGGVQRQD
jgi:hypothetical protein